jgi:hypothetical protein
MSGEAARRALVTLGTVALTVVVVVVATRVPMSSTAAAPATTTSPAPAPTTTTAPQRVMLVGDSVMKEIAVAATAAVAAPVRVDFVLTPGLAVPGDAFWPQWPERIATGDPDAIAVHVGPWEISESTFGTPAWHERYAAQLQRWTDLLRSGDAAVTWLTALPTRDPTTTARLDIVNEVYANLARSRPGVSLFETTVALGSSDYREFTPDGIRLRRVDGLHLCPEATARIAGSLLRAMGVPTAPGWELGPWRQDAAVYLPEQCP